MPRPRIQTSERTVQSQGGHTAAIIGERMDNRDTVAVSFKDSFSDSAYSFSDSVLEQLPDSVDDVFVVDKTTDEVLLFKRAQFEQAAPRYDNNTKQRAVQRFAAIEEWDDSNEEMLI